MALDPYVRARALLSAFGMLRQTRHVLQLSEVAARIRERFDPSRTQNYFTLFNIARAAQRIIQSGSAVQDDPTTRLGARVLPTDPSILPSQPRYLYRVIVQAERPDGAGRTEMLVMVRSETPMTGATVIQAAFDEFNAETPPTESPRAREARFQPSVLTAFIISAGQKP